LSPRAPLPIFRIVRVPRPADRHLANLPPLHPRERPQGSGPLSETGSAAPLRREHRKFVMVLVALFALEFVALAISPVSRSTWLLENMLVVGLGGALLMSYRRFRFSRVSYTLLFVFLALHESGAHYTYSLVPYDEWSQRFLGFSLNESFGFQRNHFDRALHFLYGLLFAYPIREVFLRIANVRGF